AARSGRSQRRLRVVAGTDRHARNRGDRGRSDRRARRPAGPRSSRGRSERCGRPLRRGRRGAIRGERVSTAPKALSDRDIGWLRSLPRKETTPDSWARDGHPPEHGDNVSDEPMLCWYRFDLIDSTYAVAMMADVTPAWREVYAAILDELIFRHTGWWAA